MCARLAIQAPAACPGGKVVLRGSTLGRAPSPLPARHPQAVRGNAAVALMLTVSSNLLSVLSVPLLLRWVLGSAAGAASFSPLAICLGLARTVVAPLLAGVAVQLAVPGVPAWRAARRRQLSYLSAGLLAFIPWMQISRAAAGRLPLGPGTLASAAATGLGIHLVFLATNVALTSLIRFSTISAVAGAAA